MGSIKWRNYLRDDAVSDARPIRERIFVNYMADFGNFFETANITYQEVKNKIYINNVKEISLRDLVLLNGILLICFLIADYISNF